MAWGSQIGVAHSQVNDIYSRMSGFHLDLVDCGKDIRRQSVQSGKFCHDTPLSNGMKAVMICYKNGHYTA